MNANQKAFAYQFLTAILCWITIMWIAHWPTDFCIWIVGLVTWPAVRYACYWSSGEWMLPK